jgi:hypothetical protein
MTVKTIIVTDSFDITKPIGFMTIEEDKLPLSPHYVFSLGYRLDPFEILEVALIPDERYKGYLKKVEEVDAGYLATVLRNWLKDNDPEGFGCACTPDNICGTCRERSRQAPLRRALETYERMNNAL